MTLECAIDDITQSENTAYGMVCLYKLGILKDKHDYEEKQGLDHRMCQSHEGGGKGNTGHKH